MKVSADYKKIGLDSLKGNWRLALIAAFAASVMGATGALGFGSSDSETTLDLIEKISGEGSLATLRSALVGFLTVSIIWKIIVIIVSGPARLGYATFNLKLVDREKPTFLELFKQFRRFGEGFWMNLLTGIYISLWSMLFVIPGIVKTYSYAMTPYILAENPGMLVNDAITKSRQIMDGHKSRLFCLELSFIGWKLLCAAPMVIVSIYLYKAVVAGASLNLLLWIIPAMLLTAICFVLLCPYIEATYAAFYVDISREKYKTPLQTEA